MTLKEDIQKAVEVLRKGGLILYPTDTVWGIGCDASNEEAVRKVYRLKQREDSKSMLVLLDAVGRIPSYVSDAPDVALDLIEIADRPTTVIFDCAKNLATNLIAADGTIGIRVTQEEVSMQLCRAFRGAIVSTSANISGQPTPAIYSEISEEIRKGVDYVMESRRNDARRAKPSSILKIDRKGCVKIIRE